MQYTVHQEISNQIKLNIRLNDHRKGIKSSNVTLPYKHLNQGCNFNNDAKFTLIETLNLKNVSSDLKIQRLKERENFWIKKLKTHIHYGLYNEVNFPGN